MFGKKPRAGSEALRTPCHWNAQTNAPAIHLQCLGCGQDEIIHMQKKKKKNTEKKIIHRKLGGGGRGEKEMCV